MTDIVFVLVVLTFFALATAYVSLCDRLIGPDPELEPSDGAQPHETDLLDDEAEAHPEHAVTR